MRAEGFAPQSGRGVPGNRFGTGSDHRADGAEHRRAAHTGKERSNVG